MDHMTLKEASEKWGVTPRRINYLCAAGRIPGAIKNHTLITNFYDMLRDEQNSDLFIRLYNK